MAQRNSVDPLPGELVTPDGASVAGGVPDDSKPLSVLGLLNVLLRRRRMIFAFPLIALLAMVPSWFRSPGARQYTAITTFDVEGAARPGTAEGLAGQLGLGGAPTRPMYTQLLRTRALLGQVTSIPFTVRTPEGVRRGTVADLYGISASTPDERREVTIEKIRGMTELGSGSDETPSLRVTTSWPDLSTQLADTLVVRLNEFNTRRQQSRVSQERRFTEARLEEKRQELRAVEARMQAFLLANRDFRNSPILSFEHNRIERDLQLKQSLYNTLANAYEVARIDEVRNSPVVSVIEPAYIPRNENQPLALRMPPKQLLVRLVLALMLGTFAAFVVEFYVRNRAQHPSDREEFRRLARQLATDVRRPWRLFAR